MISVVASGANAETIEPSANNPESTSSRDFRPKRSTSGPAASAPTNEPSDAPATTMPVATGPSLKGRNTRADPMFDESNPNRNPPIVASTAR